MGVVHHTSAVQRVCSEESYKENFFGQDVGGLRIAPNAVIYYWQAASRGYSLALHGLESSSQVER